MSFNLNVSKQDSKNKIKRKNIFSSSVDIFITFKSHSCINYFSVTCIEYYNYDLALIYSGSEVIGSFNYSDVERLSYFDGDYESYIIYKGGFLEYENR